jgi:hypothetical protein
MEIAYFEDVDTDGTLMKRIETDRQTCCEVLGWIRVAPVNTGRRRAGCTTAEQLSACQRALLHLAFGSFPLLQSAVRRRLAPERYRRCLPGFMCRTVCFECRPEERS